MVYVSPNETREYKSSKTSYASKYYDPQKAHEYYLQNRELKGYSTKGLSDEGKEVWKVAKSNINSEKKNKLKEASENYKAKVATYRKIAADKRSQILETIKSALNSITDDAKKQRLALSLKQKMERSKLSASQKSERDSATKTSESKINSETYRSKQSKEAIRDASQRKVEKLREAMKNTKATSVKEVLKRRINSEIFDRASKIKTETDSSAENKKKIRDARAKTLQAISDKYKKSATDLSNKYSSLRETLSEQASAEKQSKRDEKQSALTDVKNSMNTSIEAAKKELESKKNQITSIYSSIFDSEYSKILTTYAKDETTSKSSSGFQITEAQQAKLKQMRESRRKRKRGV